MPTISPCVVDIHCHFPKKPMYQIPQKNTWQFIGENKRYSFNRFPLSLLSKAIKKNVALYSQSNLDKCIEGNVRVLFVSLCPSERPFFDGSYLLRAFVNFKNRIKLAIYLTGLNEQIIKKYFIEIKDNGVVDYYNELLEEYQYLYNEAVKDKNLVIVSTFEQLQATLNDENKVAVIITIEGLHSLLTLDKYKHLFEPVKTFNNPSSALYKKYLTQFETNILHLKEWKNCPFFITFTHHFWNFLCGHAPSIKSFTIDQNHGKNSGFTKLGLEVLRLLLTKKNGRRILIDIKHMSLQARMDFYNFLKMEYNNHGDNIPVIASHTCVSGLKQEALLKGNFSRKGKSFYDTNSINLTDEDILAIWKSNGLIGLNLNKKRMPGAVSFSEISNTRKDVELRLIYTKLIVANILHIVSVCNDASGWKIICLGTDFDGLISAMEPYNDSSKLPLLEKDIYDFLSDPDNIPFTVFTKEKITEQMAGYKPEKLVEMIFYENTTNFLKKFFTQSYLKD